MTRDAVWRTYRDFLERVTEEMLEVVAERFGGGLSGKAARLGAKRVTKRINDEMYDQGELVVDYAAAVAAGDADRMAYEREFLETNPVYTRYSGDRTAELESHLLDHFEAVAADLAPLVASETDDFWVALREEFDREQAEEIVDRQFSQAETFKQYRDGIFSSERLGDRVIDVVETAEARFKQQLHEELAAVYDER
ncbi:MAG: hypothetical protein ABEH56_08735 [Salinirussus sp.]